MVAEAVRPELGEAEVAGKEDRSQPLDNGRNGIPRRQGSAVVSSAEELGQRVTGVAKGLNQRGQVSLPGRPEHFIMFIHECRRTARCSSNARPSWG